MKTILLCTSSKTLLEHWRESIVDVYVDVIAVSSERGLFKSLDQNQNAIVVFDCNFDKNPKEYILSLIECYPAVNILYMDDTPSFKTGKELLPVGIKGYANSRLSSIHLLQALSFIDDGKVWLYPEFIQRLIQEASVVSKKEYNDDIDKLTEKEKQVALLVARGYSNKLIAMKLDVTEATIKVHLRSIFKKLHVTDRLSLALIFR